MSAFIQKPVLTSLGATESPNPDFVLVEVAHLVPVLEIPQALLGRHFKGKQIVMDFYDFHVKNHYALGYQLYKKPVEIPKRLLDDIINLLDTSILGHPAWALFAHDKRQTERLLEDLHTFGLTQHNSQKTMPQLIKEFTALFPHYKKTGKDFRTDHRSKTNKYKDDNVINSRYKALLVNDEWQQTQNVIEKLTWLHGLSQGEGEIKEEEGTFDWGKHSAPLDAHAHTLLKNLANQAQVKKESWEEMVSMFHQKALTNFIPFAPLLIATIWTQQDPTRPKGVSPRAAPPSLNTLASLLGYSVGTTTYLDMTNSQIDVDAIRWKTLNDLRIETLGADVPKHKSQNVTQFDAPSPFRMTPMGIKRIIGKFLLTSHEETFDNYEIIRQNIFKNIIPIPFRQNHTKLKSSTVLRHPDARSQRQKDSYQWQQAQHDQSPFFSLPTPAADTAKDAVSTLNPLAGSKRKRGAQPEPPKTTSLYWPPLDRQTRLHDDNLNRLYVITKSKEVPQYRIETKDQSPVPNETLRRLHDKIQLALDALRRFPREQDPEEELKLTQEIRNHLYSFHSLHNKDPFIKEITKNAKFSLRTHLGNVEMTALTRIHLEEGLTLENFDQPDAVFKLPHPARRLLEALAVILKQDRHWYKEHNEILKAKGERTKEPYWLNQFILETYRQDVINLLPIVLYYKWLHEQNLESKLPKQLYSVPNVAYNSSLTKDEEGFTYNLKPSKQKMDNQHLDIINATTIALKLMHPKEQDSDCNLDVFNYFIENYQTNVKDPNNLFEFFFTLETKVLGIKKSPTNKRPPRWWNRMKSKSERTLVAFSKTKIENGKVSYDKKTQILEKEKELKLERDQVRKTFTTWLREQRKKLKNQFPSHYQILMRRYEPLPRLMEQNP